jgi:hypothetical protein
LRRAADSRLIAQHFVGQPIGADFGKLDGEAHIVQLAQRLPVLRREIGGGRGGRIAQAERFARHHAIERVAVARGQTQRSATFSGWRHRTKARLAQ